MRAVTFQGPGEVRLDERPEPELEAPDDAVVAAGASGICGSDLHLYTGRIPLEPGFTLGHEYVGTVTAAGGAGGRGGGRGPGPHPARAGLPGGPGVRRDGPGGGRSRALGRRRRPRARNLPRRLRRVPRV